MLKVIPSLLLLIISSLFLTTGCSYSEGNDQGLNSSEKDTGNIYTIRVLSFNIQHGKVTDGSINLDLYAQIIRKQKPDLVALSEVDKGVNRSGNVDQTAKLGKLTGLKGYFGKFRNYGGGDYGDAILSKLPVVDFKVIPANSQLDPKHDRTYIFAKIKIADSLFVYFNCSHLTPYVEKQKTIQAKELLSYYDSVLQKAPLLICGDLNSFPTSNAMEKLFTRFNPSDPYFKPTFNVRKNLTRKIDYILYPKKGDWEVAEYKRIIRDDASDHCAILSVLKFKPSQ
jgi:endonuclease/exonuclease/phosphatase family metal-dependent hydrolase